MKILLAGDGSQKQNYQTLLDKYQLHERVRMLGYISEAEKLTYYAHAAAVFFGPYDEDYGYITLEAMLSSRPVLTCTDSGGPLEFVQHNNTGWICEPEPELIAEQIDWIYEHRARVEKMGLAGRAHYEKLDISWHTVVEKLTGK
jgi:glycosyltransferase involved in cell wall biosynthesis